MLDIRSTIAAMVTALALACAGPAAAENVLRFTGKDAWAATLDPACLADEDNKGATYQVYEALLDVNSNLAVVPQLALAWQILDPTHWEFDLRQGVRFHDGTPFTAEDVVFSIERARRRPRIFGAGSKDRGGRGDRRSYHSHHDRGTGPVALAEARRRGDHVEGLGRAHGVTEPANFIGAHEETYASRHANGTGPFMLESFEPRGRWVMVRNHDWWGSTFRPQHRPHRPQPERDPENVAALLDGEIDLLQTAPYWALAQIRSNPG